MTEQQPFHTDEEHRPFAVLLASKPPAQKGKARSTAFSLILHAIAGGAFAWATMAMAEEVTEEEEEAVIVEFVNEVNVPPPPPPPPPPDMPMVEDVFRGFQTLEIPTVMPPDIPPPSQAMEFRASDFTGEGVAGGRGNGARIADPNTSSVEPDRNTPTFTPMTVRPEILNTDEIVRELIRQYPPILRDAGIGGTVVVNFFIDTNGRVGNSVIDKSSGHAQLDNAALKVAEIYRFRPAKNRDQIVAVWVTFPITFRVNP